MTGVSSVRALRAARRRSGVAGVIVSLLALLFVGSMLTILLAVAIWPGEVKLVAPLFCSDAQPDAFVVTDTYSTEPGETTTNFTLYCMGPGGDATDHGYFVPFLATMALNTAVLVVVIFVVAAIRRLRRRMPSRPAADRPRPPEGSTAGPFVS